MGLDHHCWNYDNFFLASIILECSLHTCLVSVEYDQLVLMLIVLGPRRGAVEGGGVGHVTVIVIADVGAGNAADAAGHGKRGAAQETGVVGGGMWYCLV